MQLQPLPITVELPEVNFEAPKKLPEYYRRGQDGTVTELSKGEYKLAMRKEWTRNFSAHTLSCGHIFTPHSEPRQRNCEACWFTFFQVHGELTQAAEEVFAKFGKDGLTRLRGPKFTKNLLLFLGAVAQYRAALEAAQKGRDEAETAVREA